MINDDREDWEGLVHDDDDNDDDDDDDDGDDNVHVFDPTGDGAHFLLILLVFMVTVSFLRIGSHGRHLGDGKLHQHVTVSLILFILFCKGFPWGTNREASPLRG